jgi:hypothetical protein
MEFLLNRFRNLTVLLVVVMAQLLLLAYQVKSNRECGSFESGPSPP